MLSRAEVDDIVIIETKRNRDVAFVGGARGSSGLCRLGHASYRVEVPSSRSAGRSEFRRLGLS